MSTVTKFFVGVDLHKTIIQICVVAGDGSQAVSYTHLRAHET